MTERYESGTRRLLRNAFLKYPQFHGHVIYFRNSLGKDAALFVMTQVFAIPTEREGSPATRLAPEIRG